ncbi:MAG: hypothetical protein ACOYN4_01050 [Bacteroidales bacterium]
MAISTSGFCHATQAVRHDTFIKYPALGAWLTSAWLGEAQRSKTFLEKLLKLYKAGLY